MEEAAANMMNYIRRTLTGSASPIFFFFFVLSCSSPLFCAARDTITADQPILDGQQGETLVSAGGRFEMGFFTPGNSTNKRYLGIWYHDVSPQTFVWIANRNRAIPNRTGVFTIEDGELRLRDKPGGYILWSPTMKGSTTLVNTTATLLDSGNLILTGGVDGGQNGSLDPIWQSFVDDVDHPSDTFLPGMTLEGGRILRAWSDESDPTPGSFSFQRDGSTFYQLSITNESTIYWKSGGYFNAPPVPILVVSLLSNFSSTANRSTNNTKSWYRNINNDSTKPDYTTRLVIDPSGQIKYLTLKDDVWNLVWSEPNDKCSVYKACGAFGVCNNENKPTCTCLPGFEPQKPEEWGSGKYSGGCKRKTEGCGNVFINLNIVKVKGPESSYADAKNEMDCKQECRDKCCNAYFFEPPLRPDIKGKASSCWIWSEDENIKDLQVDYSGDSRRKLHILVSSSDLGVATPKEPDHSASSAKRRYLTVFISIAAGVVLSCTVIFICCLRRMAKTKGHRERENSAFQLAALGQHPTDIINPDKFGKDEKRGIDVPFFHYKRIAASTENFSDSNKLGEGGFGLVYKGQLPGGQEIAVKRLSKNSGQGLEEFKNEVLLIAKLQHRNLVRLLGYSVKGDEKMLLYEYMPNKSLDSFIFDRTRRLLLNWQRRFNIILGIARGLLYLHQDSRLRIIHRDLKTSNILLDEEMNPKISDFGLARIFGGNQIEANTNRVVGTYGYMSPEYALDGFFSIKSDVFSFGVVLLEIISGKKNTGFYQTDKSLSLLGYAWKLWQEDKALDLMDRSLRESCNTCEVMKCINVGLLCVQEEADDRPTMSNVVFMLGRETATLAIPKQPAFIVKRVLSSSTSSSSSRRQTSSNNQQITITMEGR
ncbi:PREDICTED: G-type lectin S-receptor-like serine/threonine-protein kinase At4g03230 isoform X2 [Nelumbo nucifera]|uniref:Receptor-like serine/threonine-protein kinase n=1 Tax=Nelumbo nucifera TaxID=4432 RepID=A0A1U8Q9H4_NELNU|nr:PREDICTED: G-type lectin S-receptor-like serine/threonine-protein kinase At4g03230 isoform X2 [Nelumbo nucifera]